MNKENKISKDNICSIAKFYSQIRLIEKTEEKKSNFLSFKRDIILQFLNAWKASIFSGTTFLIGCAYFDIDNPSILLEIFCIAGSSILGTHLLNQELDTNYEKKLERINKKLNQAESDLLAAKIKFMQTLKQLIKENNIKYNDFEKCLYQIVKENNIKIALAARKIPSYDIRNFYNSILKSIDKEEFKKYLYEPNKNTYTKTRKSIK